MKKNLDLAALLTGEGFTPLEESKEGVLRGGFAAIATILNNCNCNTIPNDCKCNGNSCNQPASTLNPNCACGVDNCDCTSYGSSSSSGSSKTTQALILPFI